MEAGALFAVKIVVRDEALDELNEARSWYDEVDAELGASFEDEVEVTFRRVGRLPRSHQIVYQGLRRALLRRYPHGIFYRFVNDELVVAVACFHPSRDPRDWMER